MYARTRSQVHLRAEDFGCSIYVADRDDIFLFDLKAMQVIRSFTTKWKAVPKNDYLAITRLAEIGVLDAKLSNDSPLVAQQSYSGVHMFGDFIDIPLVNKPLLINCFSTAWCPLKCVYCHADDLMGNELRTNENNDSIDMVAVTATAIPALVYVITGGDPLTRPERAKKLAKKIPLNAGVVIDTSGAGSVKETIDLLKIRPMHLRVSIDSMDPRINKKTRPVNANLRHELQFGKDESLDMACRLIDEAGKYATGVTVQTVISSKNDTTEHLFQFRDWLISRGVKNWVLHIAINAGAAKRFSIRTPEDKKWLSAQPIGHSLNLRKSVTILPDREEASKAIRQLIESTSNSKLNIDIRCTDGNTAPNSVFLVGSEGSLYTQGRGPDGGRKVKLFEYGNPPTDIRSLWSYVSALDHVQRYINFIPIIHGSNPKGNPLW